MNGPYSGIMEEQKTEEITTVTQQTPPAQIVKTTKKVIPPPVETEHPQKRYESKKAIFRTYQIIWYIVGVIETLLFFRIILKAFGADPLSGFVYFIYLVSEPFAAPFSGMFRNISEGVNVFELGTFIGSFVYLVVAWGIVELLQLVKPTTPREVEENV